MSRFKLPEGDKILDTLKMVVGDDAGVEPGPSSEISGYSHVARFVDDDGELVGLCFADLHLAAALGAALSMIPPAAAEEMVKDGELTDIATGNLYEVMNILSSLFMDDHTPHLKLSGLAAGVDEVAGVDVAAFARADYAVSAGRYGNGSMAFLSS